MCKCVDIEIGSYDRQTVLVVPKSLDIRMNAPGRAKRSTVAVDTCLLQEVAELWHLGIITTGCCCGHNKLDGYIGVESEFIPKMKELGYKVAPNHLYPEREDSFIPKSTNR